MQFRSAIVLASLTTLRLTMKPKPHNFDKSGKVGMTQGSEADKNEAGCRIHNAHLIPNFSTTNRSATTPSPVRMKSDLWHSSLSQCKFRVNLHKSSFEWCTLCLFSNPSSAPSLEDRWGQCCQCASDANRIPRLQFCLDILGELQTPDYDHAFVAQERSQFWDADHRRNQW